jgi:thiamine-monophosphate kinase
MAPGEFDIIRTYFTRPVQHPTETLLSVGDDAALMRTPDGCDMAISVDTLNAGVHFPLQTAAYDIGWKSLAVNLSDMAAMGATPAWFTLALSLPSVDEAWLHDFSQGLFALADRYHLDLIGGDTTRGPLSISIQIGGWVQRNKYLARAGAQVGDRVYVSGTLGNAALALMLVTTAGEVAEADRQALLQRLNRPTPRVELGKALVGIASACIDISDGLAADLGHILEQSHVGARLTLTDLPCSVELQRVAADPAKQLDYVLHGGDDYELCFTLPATQAAAFEQHCQQQHWPVSAIGVITREPGLWLVDAAGIAEQLAPQGYQHFLTTE